MTYNNTDIIHTFIEQAPAAMAMFDRDMRYLAVSRRWLSDFGLGNRDLRSLSHYDIFPDQPKHWRHIHQRALQGEVVAAAEDCYQHEDGMVQWLRWEVRPWYNKTELGGVVIFSEDITKLRREQERFKVLVDASPSGMILLDEMGKICFINQHIQKLFGYEAHELLGQPIEKLLPEHLRVAHQAFRRGFQQAPTARPMGRNRDLYGLCKNGHLLPIEIGLAPIQGDQGWQVLASVIDITERKRAQEYILKLNAELDQRVRERTQQLEDSITALHKALAEAELLRQELREQAIRDPLTGLYNRRYMEEVLEREVLRVRRANMVLSVIMFDVDNFKSLNDHFGHFAGDHALRCVSHVVQAHIRSEDIACRYGGDEFVIVLPSASLADGLHRAQELRQQLRHFWLEAKDAPLPELGLSMGVAEFPKHGVTVKELLLAADSALYRAKQQGRNCVVEAIL